jgi:hypothetical protein
MSEFSNRITAQREILNIVNNRKWDREELFGLSNGAIDRWQLANGIERNNLTVILVSEAAEKLFFLANKSQEQISPEYGAVEEQIIEIVKRLRSHINAVSIN